MKTLISLVASVLVLLSVLVLNGKTDPFGAQTAIHKVTSISPSLAYAASPSVVDGNQPAANNLITWHNASVTSDMDEIEGRLSKGDKLALCASPSKALKEHPKYKRWCEQ